MLYCDGLRNRGQCGWHAGMIEYWSVLDHQFPEEAVSFKYKMETDLFALAKAKTRAGSLSVSADGTQFAIFGVDRYIALQQTLDCFDMVERSCKDFKNPGLVIIMSC